MDRETIVKKLVLNEDPLIIDEIDSFMYVYDHLPPKMKQVFDMYFFQKKDKKDISRFLKVTIREVDRKLETVKKRILRGENII